MNLHLRYLRGVIVWKKWQGEVLTDGTEKTGGGGGGGGGQNQGGIGTGGHRTETELVKRAEMRLALLRVASDGSRGRSAFALSPVGILFSDRPVACAAYRPPILILLLARDAGDAYGFVEVGHVAHAACPRLEGQPRGALEETLHLATVAYLGHPLGDEQPVVSALNSSVEAGEATGCALESQRHRNLGRGQSTLV